MLMNCCTNPIELGCKSSCGPITTNIATSVGDTFTIVWLYNGVYQSTQIVSEDAFLTIPPNTFNESSPVTFQVYDAVNKFVACYKATIIPGNVTFETNPPEPILFPFTTSIEILPGSTCSNDEWSGVMAIHYNNINALQLGSVLDLHHDILHNGSSRPHSITSITGGLNYVGDDLIVTDMAQITNPILLEVKVTSKNCNHSFTIDAVIDYVEHLSSSFENTLNTPLTTFVWP